MGLRNVPAIEPGFGEALIDTLELVFERQHALLELDQTLRELATACRIGDQGFELVETIAARPIRHDGWMPRSW